MKSAETQAASMALSALFLDLFRAHGRLIAAGDQLIAPLGLTSARWQVLGAVAMAGTPRPVAHIAGDLGLARQGVQRIVNELAEDGFLAFEDNPRHRRAKLVRLTPRGSETMTAVAKVQRPWVDGLAAGLDPTRIAIAAEVLAALWNRLDREAGAEGTPKQD
jgi:DNA-binding MarR family transcriptional regulator